MEFYNRMKQKLAEELEQDEPLEIPEGKSSSVQVFHMSHDEKINL